jgi:prepilin-type N-terminal cleavage/methylation domain-containing protein
MKKLLMPKLNTRRKVHAQLRRQAGFTLAELMLVCMIIAVIAAIAIPSLIASRRAGYENTAKQKLAAIGQQQTAFRTLLRKGRYSTIAELQTTIAGGSALLTSSDVTVTGWMFSDEGSSTTTTFGEKVVPTSDNPAAYSFYISEDQTLRRCARTGPWTKTDCPPQQ